MRKRLIKFGLLLWAGSAFGQSVPITAKAREIREIYVQGSKIETRIQEGSYYRNSAGATLEEWTTVTLNGKAVKGSGVLTDPNLKLSFHLDFANLIARQETLSPGKPPDSDKEVAAKIANLRPSSLSQKSVGGILCTVHPVFILDPRTKEFTYIGEACTAENFQLVLSRSFKLTTPEGKTTIIKYELYDIQPNLEPNSSLFDLRERGFTIYGPLPQ